MTDSPPETAVQLLPVLGSIKETYAAVFGQSALFIKAVAFPLLLSTILWHFWDLLSDVESVILGVSAFYIDLIPYAFFGVAWHRLTLLGPDEGRPPLLPRPSRRHVIFFALAAIVTSIYHLPLRIIEIAAEQGWSLSSLDTGEFLFWLSSVGMVLIVVVFYLGIPYLMFRLSFVFPAAAVDERYRLRHSWRHTRHEGVRLLLLGGTVGAPAYLLVLLISVQLDAVFGIYDPTKELSFGSIDGIVYGVVAYVLLPALSYVPIALVISAISLAFRICTGWVPAGSNRVQLH
jgi:hypothetical protein